MQLLKTIRETMALFRLQTNDMDLVREQVRVMELQLPWLYFTLLINAAALVYTYYGTAPDYLTIWPFGLWVVLFGFRMIAWFWFKKNYRLHAENVKKLKSLLIVGMFIGSIYNIWGLQLFAYGSDQQKAHVAVFLCITVIGCLSSVVQLPTLTLSLLGVAIINFLTFAIISGEPILITMAIAFALVLVVVAHISKILFMNFYGQIKSQREVMDSKIEIEMINRELVFHRDNLKAEVQKRTQQLEQALRAEQELNRLQNEFVSMVSHEFRTPLTIIDGTARRIDKHLENLAESDVRERLQRVRSAVSRLTVLIDRTLDASRLAAGRIRLDPMQYDLKALIREAVERQQDISPDFKFNIQINALPDRALGDVRLLDNVVTNLLSNAVKYSGNSRQIEITAAFDGTTMTLSILDHGIGIPKADLKKISTRFFRASNATGIQGTGIGMNLIRSLIELHQGRLRVESEEGEWTRATIYLPVRPEFDQLGEEAEPASETETGPQLVSFDKRQAS